MSSSSVVARPVDGIAVKVLEGKPVIQPDQDSTPDSQPMEGTTYLEHPALGVSLDSRLRKGISRTEKLEQSVLGEGSIVRPETAVTSEHHHKQSCFKLSARPTPASGLTDVKIELQGIPQKYSSNQCSERGRSYDQKWLLRQNAITNRHVLNCRRGRRRRVD